MKHTMNFITFMFITLTILCFYFSYSYDNKIFNILFVSFFTTSYHFVMRLLVGWSINYIHINYDSNWFQQKKHEAAIYDFLKVHEWKNYMPTYNPESFSLKKHTLNEIYTNTIVSELCHEINIILSYIPLLFSFIWGEFFIFLITSIIASIFDSVFVIMQRYNRPRILKLINKRRAIIR